MVAVKPVADDFLFIDLVDDLISVLFRGSCED